MAHVPPTNGQDNLPEIGTNIVYQANRMGVAEPCADPAVHQSLDVDCARLTYDDALLRGLASSSVQRATQHAATPCYRLRSIPGVGQLWALGLRYELQDIRRFPRRQAFASSCRLVKWAKESAGMRYGTAGTKIGNASLQWAFSAVAVLCLRTAPAGQQGLARVANKHDPGHALTLLAHTLARAVDDMLQRQTVLEMNTSLHQ